MRVLLINGSPHEFGCTYTALHEVEATLNKHGIETEIFHLGTQPIPGCIACGACAKTGACFRKDIVNEVAAKLETVDGVIFGSPVYYAGANGQILSFLDRLFYSSGRFLSKKPGAAVVSCRRGGASAAFEQLNKYFQINNMPQVPSNYWNQVHGIKPEDVLQDEEGMQTMRILGENMAWLLKLIENGRQAGVPEPEYESKIKTNFVR